MKKKVVRALKLGALIYGILGIAFYYLQDQVLFHPVALGQDYVFHFPFPNREVTIPYDLKTRLNIIQFTTKEVPPRGVVLYFHGNRNNVEWYARFAPNFTSAGYEVWMMDYPGFGKSTGPFTEARLYAYALEFYKMARSRFAPGQIVIYGKSMGTGVASQLASVRDCRYLILETPYYTMPSLVSHYLPIYPVSSLLHYRFPNCEFLKKVDAPVVLFHGTSDGVIPFGQALQLQTCFKAGDRLVALEGGSHNNLSQFTLFHQVLDSLLNH